MKEKSAKKPNNKFEKKKRITIPAKTKSLLQKEIKSICPFCPSEDVDHFEIHHIDENPSNNQFENLLMLCPTCHSKITKGDIAYEEVILKKKILDNKEGLSVLNNIYKSESTFRDILTKLISDKTSVYYKELKEHWNSYSLIDESPFLNEIINRSLQKTIGFGLLPLISDLVGQHLYYDKDAKYIYNQPHIYCHNHEEEGYNLPIYYHIRFIGILYATAIRNKVDIDNIARFYKNMQSIFSAMVEGIVDNLNADGFDSTKEYPTNFHWLIGEIFSVENNWLNQFNDENYFVQKSSYLNFIPFNLRLCYLELYKGFQKGKIDIAFLIRKYYYGVLSEYLSITTNDFLRTSIEKHIISEIPTEIIEPLLDFCLEEKFAISYNDFYQGRFGFVTSKEREILSRLKTFIN